MSASPHPESAFPLVADSAPHRLLTSAIGASAAGTLFKWMPLRLHHLPALMVVALLVAWSVLTLRGAREEGRQCGARGGVIMEIDDRAYDSAQVKPCTADY
jgi:hypothetical protein